MNQLFPVEQSEKTSDDYLTPSWVFEALNLTFDLDVAAPPWDTHVPALRKYTKADDGLTADWYGRVWMNPPYSKVTPWVDRFILHRHGIAFVPFARSHWLNRLWDESDGLVVPANIGSFAFDGGQTMAYPVYLAAFGAECVEAISRLGRVR